MSEDGQAGAPPPPGWQPAPPSAPSYQQGTGDPASPPPSYAASHPGYARGNYAPSHIPSHAQNHAHGYPPPGMLAAHKPGAMPLRPLGLGDIFDAAFRTIRFNPKATVGSAALVAAVAMVIPVVITAILTATLDLSLSTTGTGGLSGDLTSGQDFDTSSIVGLVASFGSLGLGLVLAGFGTLLVTGMIAHVTAAAAVGRRLSLGSAWAATRGKRWRLVGLALALFSAYLLMAVVYAAAWVLVVVLARDSAVTIVVWAVVSVPVFLTFLVWFWVRVYYLPVPVLMLEQVGVFGAVRRGFALTRRQFWRTLGIGLLTAIVVGIAGQIIGFPVGLIGELATFAVGDRYTVLALVLTQAVTQVVTLSFTTPFTSAVTSLQYLDQRMRKEAYDVELMQQAGIAA